MKDVDRTSRTGMSNLNVIFSAYEEFSYTLSVSVSSSCNKLDSCFITLRLLALEFSALMWDAFMTRQLLRQRCVACSGISILQA